MQQFSDKDP